jgi:hypothetical protein
MQGICYRFGDEVNLIRQVSGCTIDVSAALRTGNPRTFLVAGIDQHVDTPVPGPSRRVVGSPGSRLI